MSLRECHLSHVLIDELTDSQVIFLSEHGGARRFPIIIGALEAVAIDRGVKQQPFPRPLTHDLLATTIAACDRRVDEIRIVDLRDGTFYAEVVLVDPDGTRRAIDARPSDAIALLVRSPGTRLLVEEEVLEAAHVD